MANQTSCPECDRILWGRACPCGWSAPAVTEATSIAEVAPPWEDDNGENQPISTTEENRKKVQISSTEENGKNLQLSSVLKKAEPWRWTTGRVVTQAQVDHIIRQSEFAGGRAAWFLAECIDAGIIREGRLCKH